MRALLARWLGFADAERTQVVEAFKKLPQIDRPELAAKMTRRQLWDTPDPIKVKVVHVFRVLSTLEKEGVMKTAARVFWAGLAIFVLCDAAYVAYLDFRYAALPPQPLLSFAAFCGLWSAAEMLLRFAGGDRERT